PFVEIRRPDGDPVARLQPGREERARGAEPFVRELGERESHVAVLDGAPLAEAFGGGEQEAWDRRFHRPQLLSHRRLPFYAAGGASPGATAVRRGMEP